MTQRFPGIEGVPVSPENGLFVICGVIYPVTIEILSALWKEIGAGLPGAEAIRPSRTAAGSLHWSLST
jgi:hypothetical protein